LLGASLALPGENWFQTAWRTPHAAKRHALSKASARSFPPGAITLSARRHAFQASLVFPYRLAAHLTLPGATKVMSLLLVFWHFGASSKVPQALNIQSVKLNMLIQS